MNEGSPRSAEQRRAHAEALLSSRHADAWVASASSDGKEHLVPLSIGWDGARVMLASPAEAVTTRNIRTAGRARIAVGTTRDVVMIDAALEDAIAVEEAPDAIAETYAAQSDWDPRQSTGYVFLLMRPQRIQAWREADEIAGRTIMRDGEWTA